MDIDDNPFRAPGTAAGSDLLDDDRAARTRLLGAEARLSAVGTLWMAAAVIQLAYIAPLALFSAGMAVFGGGEGALELLAVAAVYGLGAYILYWYFTIGRDLRALKSVDFGDVRLWALLGVCCGPCTAFNLVIPFLILRRDAAAVLTPEHAALRERAPDLTPPTTATLLMIVGGFASVMFALTFAMIFALGFLSAVLGHDLHDPGQAIPVEDQNLAPHPQSVGG